MGSTTVVAPVLQACLLLLLAVNAEAVNNHLEVNEEAKGQTRIHRRIASAFWTVWKAEVAHLCLRTLKFTQFVILSKVT